MPRILLTRSAEGNAQWAEILSRHGVEAVSLPCLEHRLVDDAETRHRVAQLWHGEKRAPWWALTSPRGARSVAELLPAEAGPGPRLAAVGPSTAEACVELFGTCDLVAEPATGTALAQALVSRLGAEDRLVVAAADRGRLDLESVLRPHGVEVLRIHVYRTLAAETADSPVNLAHLELDGIFIASPSAGEGLAALATWPADFRIPVTAIGPTTAAALASRPETRKFNVNVATSPSVEGMLAAWRQSRSTVPGT